MVSTYYVCKYIVIVYYRSIFIKYLIMVFQYMVSTYYVCKYIFKVYDHSMSF